MALTRSQQIEQLYLDGSSPVKATQVDKEFSINYLVVKIDGKVFNHFSAFTLKRTLTEFIDTFTITCDNPGGIFSRTIHTGDVFQVYFQGVEIFRGTIETKNVQWSRVGSSVTFGGREELAKLAEDDVDPSIFVNDVGTTTDNTIIQAVVSDFPWKQDFDAPVTIQAYDVAGGSTRKAQIIADVAKKNNFYVWKKGLTLYKKKLPKFGEAAKETMIFSSGVNSRGKWTDKILTMEIKEDITGVRSQVIAGVSLLSKDKSGGIVPQPQTNKVIAEGTYPTVIRNLLTDATVNPIKRTRYISVANAASVEESLALMERSLLETNIMASVVVTLADFHDFDLTDTVLLDAEPEGIYNTFYVSTVQYTFDKSNKRVTQLTLTPLGLLPT